MKILTALVTPFTKDDKINYEALDQLIHFQINQGADGIVIGGTTGELPTLSDEEISDLYHYVCRKYHGQIEIYLGVGCASTCKTLKKVEVFDHLPHDGYLVVVPYYNLPPQEGMYAHFKLVSEKTKKQIIIYHIPKRTGSTLELTTLERLAKLENITMVKDASPDKKRLEKVMEIPNLLLFLGDDQLYLWGIKKGVAGIVSVISNAEVSLMKQCLSDSNKHKEFEKALSKLDGKGNPIGIKGYLRSKGFDVGTVRLPLLE